ncbi:hypothetical protein [Pseudomonas chlororaphis]|uniref:hypothetical protein n=1 Tax=Pseudomonas chlororaphis TaxID=587753 RepID=UPI0012D361FF|nr:hypothetical protein [Pseudomonas chlororaphis]
MSKQTINLGTAPTGVGGDTPRSANIKIISNFDELYAALGGAGSPVALPVALPVANGGTGNTTGTAQKLAATAILGTVSQSGGTPTGAIIESGSNANGRYTKFANGTMICEGSVPNLTANNPFGGFYYSATITIGYPAQFSSRARIFGSTSAQTGSFSWASYPANGSAAVGYLNMMSPGQNATATMDWIAIGRWFE